MFSFEHLEHQRESGHLDRLLIEIHPKEVVKDELSFVKDIQFPTILQRSFVKRKLRLILIDLSQSVLPLLPCFFLEALIVFLQFFEARMRKEPDPQADLRF